MKWEQVERLKMAIREQTLAPQKAHVGPNAFSAPSDLPLFLDFGSNSLTNGAGDEVRTRDPQLGKLMLYQLSYTRPRNDEVGTMNDELSVVPRSSFRIHHFHRLVQGVGFEPT